MLILPAPGKGVRATRPLRTGSLPTGVNLPSREPIGEEAKVVITAPEPRPDRTLPAIRAALSHPRDREGFDAGLPVVVEQAQAAGDWRGVEEFTQTWWIIACVSMQDPEDRQRVWDTVDDIQRKIERGEEIPGVPLDEVLARRAARRETPTPDGERS
ncbi:DUF6247 family protein [Nonomuraea turcica]|uniref:DUF6247 family protein n=1 Tax=Nonomuraea sp. G32 TaxID=3067274 RepID=UPI00273C1004|nr:DUF6247 family protein [Nonomuraea sp. G32]MDP4504896.1 DUF6247 family protein [Nonomuraea sp. G32]